MKPLFLLIGLLLCMDVLFAQNSSADKVDSSKPVLGSNAQGVQGFIINKGNGKTEFQTVEQYAASRSATPVKNGVSQSANKKSTVTTAGAASQKKTAAVSANTVQKSKTDSSASVSLYKQPPVLAEGPPHH